MIKLIENHNCNAILGIIEDYKLTKKISFHHANEFIESLPIFFFHEVVAPQSTRRIKQPYSMSCNRATTLKQPLSQ